jgi:hypothetical protein
VINNTFASKTTAGQASTARQILKNFIELPRADYTEEGLQNYLSSIQKEIDDINLKIKTFKNQKGVKTLQQKNLLIEKESLRGKIEGFAASLYGTYTFKYIKSLSNSDSL